MISDNGVRSAKVTKVVDGDTFYVMANMKGDIFEVLKCRILRCNASELDSDDPAQKDLADKARDYVKDLIDGKDITIQLVKKDGLRRWLVEAWYINNDGAQINLSDDLLANGLAVPFTR